MKHRNRKLTEHEPNITLGPNLHPRPLLQPLNATVRIPLTENPNSPFDSSMALTVLALLIALFVMGLFSVYIRRFAATEQSSRRHNRRQISITPVYPLNRRMSAGPKGVDASTLKSLPVYNYHDGATKQWINDCSVCLGEFVEGEEVKMIPYCGHVFHVCCIEKWLSAHESCPLCRTTRFFSEEGRSTVDIGGVRRTSSGSRLGERMSLQRTSSF